MGNRVPVRAHSWNCMVKKSQLAKLLCSSRLLSVCKTYSACQEGVAFPWKAAGTFPSLSPKHTRNCSSEVRKKIHLIQFNIPLCLLSWWLCAWSTLFLLHRRNFYHNKEYVFSTLHWHHDRVMDLSFSIEGEYKSLSKTAGEWGEEIDGSSSSSAY